MDHGSAELDSSHKSIRLERGPDSPNTGVRLAAATLTIGKRYELSGCGGIAHDVSGSHWEVTTRHRITRGADRALHQFGTGTVRSRPPSPNESAMTQWLSLSRHSRLASLI